jgi:hypothetical protein
MVTFGLVVLRCVVEGDRRKGYFVNWLEFCELVRLLVVVSKNIRRVRRRAISLAVGGA